MPITTMNRLFARGYLSQFLDQRERDLDDDIASEAKDEILNSSDAVAARLLEKYSLKPVRADKDETRTKKRERGQSDRLTVSFLVPFTGSKELLELHPNSYTSGLVLGSISDGRIVVDIENAAGDHEPFRREFDSWYANMAKWLDGANNQTTHFNDSLQGRIRKGIDARAQAIRSADDVVSALGYEEMQAAGERGAEPADVVPPKAGHTVDLKIPKREDMHNEFKETFSFAVKDGSSKIVKMEAVMAVAAFTNAEGGRLFIGVNDDGEPVGLGRDLRQCKDSSDKLELAIRDFVKSKLNGVVHMEFGFSGKDYLVIEVAKRKRNFVYVGNDFYVRDGNSSRWLSPRETAEYQNEYRPA